MSQENRRRGEIWWANTPIQPDDPHQPRPVLIIPEEVRNNSPWVDDVLVVPIFSGRRSGLTRVVLPAGTGGIRHDSTVYGEEIACLDVDFLQGGPLGGRVPGEILREVVIAIRRAVGEARV